MMNIEDFKDNEPQLSLEEFFTGDTWAWGIFEDRFGNLKRSFQVTIDGRMENGQLMLDEHFIYNDGAKDRRIWYITPQGNGKYQGTAADIAGTATGKVMGNALNWQYDMNLPVGGKNWRVHFNDWMYLQPGNVLINKAIITKWGIQLGTVTLFFSKCFQ
ncbi:Protein of unknown function [Neptunomonas antarctica]|uniref:DUF3833 domain-containing protein n=1 Tax=Neptunomonas antarctica TaxID=619304 RepID=A0A1N7IWM2_9GAMM|nr:Protein of unknown function [Neptunomonas antarctica]